MYWQQKEINDLTPQEIFYLRPEDVERYNKATLESKNKKLSKNEIKLLRKDIHFNNIWVENYFFFRRISHFVFGILLIYASMIGFIYALSYFVGPISNILCPSI